MTRELRLLLLSDARRQVPYLLIVLMYLAIFCIPLALVGRPPNLADVVIWLPVMVMMATVGAQTEWRRGGPRARSRWLLPLSQQMLARSEWWLALGFPGLALSLLLLAFLLLLWALGERATNIGEIGATMVLAWGGVGYLAAVVVGIRAARDCARHRALAYAVAATAIAAPFAMPLSVLARSGLEHYAEHILYVHLGFAGLGFLAAIWLYARPALLLGVAPTHRGVGRASVRRERLRVPAARGWHALALRLGCRLLLLAVIGAASTIALTAFFGFAGETTVLVMTPFILMTALTWFLIVPLLPALRALRALPLTADRLAALLSATVLAANAVTFLAVSAALSASPSPKLPAYFNGVVPSLPVAPILIVALSCSSLLAPLLLRFGLRGVGAGYVVPALVGVVVHSNVLGFTVSHCFSQWAASVFASEIALLIAAAAVVTGYLWTRHELRSGRHVYHPQRLASLVGGARGRADAP